MKRLEGIGRCLLLAIAILAIPCLVFPTQIRQIITNWGSIGGTLSNQTDLQNALNAKQGTLTFPLTTSEGGSGQTTAYSALYAFGGQPNGAVQNVLAAAPSSPVDGAIYVADGVNWNPCSRPQMTETGTTIAFVSGSPATITDSGSGFVTAGFASAQWLLAYDNTASTTIGTFEIAQVAAGTITLKTGQTLASQSAGHSITLTARIPYFVIYSLYGNAGSAEYVGMGNIVGTTYFPELTQNTAIYGDSNGVLQSSTTTSTELSYVHGVTSAIQTQLNGKAPLNGPESALAAITCQTNKVADYILQPHHLEPLFQISKLYSRNSKYH